MKFEKTEYLIGSQYLCSLFNGDDSGLEEKEAAEFWEWAERVQGDTVGHWAGGDEETHEEFAECEVTGLRGDCHEVYWMQEVTSEGQAS